MIRFSTVLALGPALGLAACDQPAPAPKATPMAKATGDALARIAALPPAQQQLVVFRAIRDAHQPCQGINDLQRGPDIEGRAVWRATCDGAAIWVVQIGDDGIANVTGPLEAGTAKPQQTP